jgi:hypothetical protein
MTQLNIQISPVESAMSVDDVTMATRRTISPFDFANSSLEAIRGELDIPNMRVLNSITSKPLLVGKLKLLVLEGFMGNTLYTVRFGENTQIITTANVPQLRDQLQALLDISE